MSNYGAPTAPAHGRDSLPSPSSEDDSRSTGPATAGSGATQHTSGARRSSKADAGAIIEVGRKPRGRPPGSKNKPKPPIVITRDSENSMHPHVLELSAGSDVVETVSQFARRRQMGLCVLSATGTVANVTLRHPTSHTATLSIHGRFDILSLTGTCLPSPPSSTSNPSFTISLAGAQGQVIGGAVAGALIAAGPVIIIAASFISPSFHRLPNEEDEEEKPEPLQQQNVGASELQVQPPCTMSIYSNCQLPSDVLTWPPTTRSPY